MQTRTKERRAARRTESEWREVVSELLASGATTREFAASHGINPTTLSVRRAQYGVRRRAKQPRFLEVGYVPQRAAANSEIEITLRCGTKLRTSLEIEPTKLAAIVNALGQPC